METIGTNGSKDTKENIDCAKKLNSRDFRVFKAGKRDQLTMGRCEFFGFLNVQHNGK